MFLGVIDYYLTKEVKRYEEISTLSFLTKPIKKNNTVFFNESNVAVVKNSLRKKTPDISIDYGVFIVSEEFKHLVHDLNVKGVKFLSCCLFSRKGELVDENFYVMMFDNVNITGFKEFDSIVLSEHTERPGYLILNDKFRKMFESRKLVGLYFTTLYDCNDPFTVRLMQIRNFHRKQ